MLVDIIAGARPNFMKIAPIIRVMRARAGQGGPLRYRLIHTGQHYDANMSMNFFRQLGIPEPDVNLAVGSGSAAEQTAGIMIGYEEVLIQEPSALCLVVGDVTSTMACAITAQKQHIPVAHVEAGIRSGDWEMPEEINRLVTDAITNWFFTTSQSAGEELRRSGVAGKRIFFVGNTMIDTLVANLDQLSKPRFFEPRGLQENEFFVATLHRPSNVDAQDQFRELLAAISEGARGFPVVFPVHPRTAQVLSNERVADNIVIVEPQPYLEFNWLVRNSKGVVTDSGGISEETTFLGVPCMTLRTTTERPETIEIGTNELIGTNTAALRAAFGKIFAGEWKTGAIPEKWDGRASERIVEKLEEILAHGVT